MKNETDKLTVQFKGNGPIGTMLVTVDNKPEIKGYVANPIVDIPLNEDGKLDVGGAVGYEGYINVIKDIAIKRAIYRNISISFRRNCRRFCKLFCKL